MILKPDYNLQSLFNIPFDELENKQIKTIMFDLDSTVMPSKSAKFSSDILSLFEKLQKKFTLAIISNNKKEDYLKKVREQVNFTVIGNANKPNPKIIKEYLKSIKTSPENSVMIGDRPLTDILAGKLTGTKTILVDSITKDSENIPTRFVRKLERLFIRN